MSWFSIRATLGSGNAFLFGHSPHLYICFSFRYLEKTASGAITPLFFVCRIRNLCKRSLQTEFANKLTNAFINKCVKFWLNIAVTLDKRRIIY